MPQERCSRGCINQDFFDIHLAIEILSLCEPSPSVAIGPRSSSTDDYRIASISD
jgi:hypothetical protein